MRTRRPLRLALALSLALLVAGAPGAFARARARPTPQAQAFWSSPWVRLVFYLGTFWGKTGSSLDPNGQPVPRTAAETVDEGSGLDPDGVHKNGSALDPDGKPIPSPGTGMGMSSFSEEGSGLDPSGLR